MGRDMLDKAEPKTPEHAALTVAIREVSDALRPASDRHVAASALDVAAIRARARSATPAPWNHMGQDHAMILGRDNVIFVDCARTDVPALCDEVERLREEVRALRNRLRPIRTVRHEVILDDGIDPEAP
jgi:hypothetical protein